MVFKNFIVVLLFDLIAPMKTFKITEDTSIHMLYEVSVIDNLEMFIIISKSTLYVRFTQDYIYL